MLKIEPRNSTFSKFGKLDYLFYFFTFCLPFETQISTFLYVFRKKFSLYAIEYIFHPLSILIFLSIISFFYYKTDYKKLFVENKNIYLLTILCFFTIFFGYCLTYCYIGGNQGYFWTNLFFFPIALSLLLFSFARYGNIIIVILFYSYALFSFLYLIFYVNFMINYENPIIMSRYDFQYDFLMNSLWNVNKTSNLLFLSFCFVFLKENKKYNWLVLFIIILLISMFSRLTILLIFITALIYLLKRDSQSIKYFFYIFIFLLCCFMFFFLVDNVTRNEMYNMQTLMVRFEVIKSWSSYYFSQDLKNIIFGLGFQNYGLLFFNKIDAGSHNLFIDFLNNGGILALFGLVCLFGIVFRKILLNFKIINNNNFLFYSSISIFSIFILAFREYDFVYLKTQTMGGVFFIIYYINIMITNNAKKDQCDVSIQKKGYLE